MITFRLVIWPSLMPICESITEIEKIVKSLYGLYASIFETFVWILTITTSLNMIFCVVSLWLKFETHPSFLRNLKMAN